MASSDESENIDLEADDEYVIKCEDKYDQRKVKNIRMLDIDLEVTVENEWIAKFNSGFLTK